MLMEPARQQGGEELTLDRHILGPEPRLTQLVTLVVWFNVEK